MDPNEEARFREVMDAIDVNAERLAQIMKQLHQIANILMKLQALGHQVTKQLGVPPEEGK
jgi:hypothetical protein